MKYGGKVHTPQPARTAPGEDSADDPGSAVRDAPTTTRTSPLPVAAPTTPPPPPAKTPPAPSDSLRLALNGDLTYDFM